MKRHRSDDYMIGLIACFLMVIMGFCASVVVGVIAAPDPVTSLFVAITVYGSIALLPLTAIPKERAAYWPKQERPSFWSGLRIMFRQKFRRRKKREKKHKVWMRKPTDFVHTPHGTDDFANTFIPSRDLDECQQRSDR